MLIGRERECALIQELLAAAQRNVGGSLVLAGEPGIGKTSLLRWAAAEAAGLRVAAIHAGENEADLPYAALAQLIVTLGDVTGRMGSAQQRALAVVMQVDGGDWPDRFALGVATLDLLIEASNDQPLLLLVDDVQWLDAESAAAILFAVRRLRADPVAVLMTARDNTPTQATDLGWQSRLHVRGLPHEAVRSLLAAECGRSPSESLVASVLQQTAGNPFAVREVARMSASVQLAGSDELPGPLTPLDAAERLFADRCRHLAPAALRGLGLLALAEGREVGIAVQAATAAGLSIEQISSLEDEELVSFGGGTVHFAHPLLRRAAETRLVPAVKRRLHAALATAMEAAPQLVTHYAMHRAASVLGYDDQAADDLERVAQRISADRGFVAATTVLRHAAAITPPGHQRAMRLHLAGDMALVAGSQALAASLLAEARSQADRPELQARIDAILGQLQIFDGQPRQALRTLGRAVHVFKDVDRLLAAQSLADSAIAAFFAGDLVATMTLANDAHDVVPTDRGPVTLLCDVAIGGALLHLGQVDAGRDRLRSATALIPRLRQKPDAAAYAAFTTLSLMWAGDVPAARRLIEPLVADLRSLNALGVLPLALYAAAQLDLYSGRLSRGQIRATEAANLAEATGNKLWLYMALGCKALAEALRGDEHGCRRDAEAAEEISHHLDVSYPRDCSDALGLMELAGGDPQQAAQHLRKANQPDPAAPGPVFGRPTSVDFVEAAVRSGQSVPAGLRASIDQHTAGRESHVHAGDAWRCQGLLAPDSDTAATAFRTAIAIYGELDLPLHVARTRLCFGEALRRTGARIAARAELWMAADAFDQLGARPWAERARRELRATGDNTVTARGRTAPLTDQELAVATVIAPGATNKEAASILFLSPKTIEMHLSRVYSKLGIRSKTQLAAALKDQQLT